MNDSAPMVIGSPEYRRAMDEINRQTAARNKARWGDPDEVPEQEAQSYGNLGHTSTTTGNSFAQPVFEIPATIDAPTTEPVLALVGTPVQSLDNVSLQDALLTCAEIVAKAGRAGEEDFGWFQWDWILHGERAIDLGANPCDIAYPPIIFGRHDDMTEAQRWIISAKQTIDIYARWLAFKKQPTQSLAPYRNDYYALFKSDRFNDSLAKNIAELPCTAAKKIKSLGIDVSAQLFNLSLKSKEVTAFIYGVDAEIHTRRRHIHGYLVASARNQSKTGTLSEQVETLLSGYRALRYAAYVTQRERPYAAASTLFETITGEGIDRKGIGKLALRLERIARDSNSPIDWTHVCRPRNAQANSLS